MHFDGQTLFSTDASTGNHFYTSWLPRQGNRAIFAVELLAAGSGTQSVTAQVQTKDSEDGDDAAASIGSATAISQTSYAITTWEAGQSVDSGSAGMKALWRVKLTVKSAADSLGLVRVRLLVPAWPQS